MDKSGYFNIILRRGSGKYLQAIWDGREHWTGDINMALRMWSASGAGLIASGLKVKVNAVPFRAVR